MSQETALFQAFQNMIAEALAQGREWSDLKEDSKFKSLVSQLQAMKGGIMSQENEIETPDYALSAERRLELVGELVAFFKARGIDYAWAARFSAHAVEMMMNNPAYRVELKIT